MSEREGAPRRLFLGIALDDETREACSALAARFEASGVRARFVAPENYHVTLIFLGNVVAGTIPAIEATITGVASRHAPFALDFDRLGAFPHERRPRVIFAGSRGTDLAYRRLAAETNEACAQLGFASESDAIPHVTLARVPEGERQAMPMLDVAPFRLHVNSLALFESVPLKSKTRYVIRSAFGLSAEGSTAV